MEQPMIEFRNHIIVDIEKYSIQGEVKIVNLLNEYLLLIDNIYEPKEQTNMVSCFKEGYSFCKDLIEEEKRKTDYEKKLEVRKNKKINKIWESIGLVSRGKEH